MKINVLTIGILVGVLSGACPVSSFAQTTELRDGWSLIVDSTAQLSPGAATVAHGWRPVKVALSWNAQFEDMRDYMGVAWYRNEIDLLKLSDRRHYWLRFGAVDYLTRVFLNGKLVGEHEGGYTPFEFDITNTSHPGSNELLVRVYDPPMATKVSPGDPQYLYDELPHGKQDWYVQTGGIWQTVALEERPEVFIRQVHITGDADLSGKFHASVELAGPSNHGLKRLQVNILNAANQKVLQTSRQISGGEIFNFEGEVKSPRLWSLAHPNLYHIEVLLAGQTVRDQFGFRDFSTKNGGFLLNGRPFYMRAALDQDFYPSTIYSAPSKQYIREMMLKAKGLGLNMLRCHIKVPDPVYLQAADEVGMLVWYEIPSWQHFSPQAATRGENIFREMVARDWNHPSIVIQSIINESWGTDLKQAEQRTWLRGMYDRAKAITNPLRRVIVDNSACCENFHVATDVADFHQYYSIPDNSLQWDQWVDRFASRPGWIFSNFGDAATTGREPLVVSEFGNWGLPRLPEARELPWWFDRDFAGRKVTRAAGVLSRFKELGFDQMFSDFNALAEATENHQFLSLKHEIEEIRRQPALQGYVITELTDINWEANGLMDMWRNPKVYSSQIEQIQQDDMVLGVVAKHNFRSGEKAIVQIWLSHYGETSLEGATVAWRTSSGREGQLAASPANTASVSRLANVEFDLPNVGAAQPPRRETLSLTLFNRSHETVGRNSYDIFVYPKESAGPEMSFYDPLNNLKPTYAALTQHSLKLRAGPIAGMPVLAGVLDQKIESFLRGGGQVLLLADSKTALPPDLVMRITPREGSDLVGNWVTNFNWARTGAAPFAKLTFDKILGWEASQITPRYVITGNLPSEDILSGIFYGWLNNNAGLAVKANYGEGRILVTTFRFDQYGADPYATQLLHELAAYLGDKNYAAKIDLANLASKTNSPRSDLRKHP